MKIVTISGPGGAGKDSTIKELCSELEKDFPGKVSRAAFHATRPLRKEETQGEGIYSCNEEEFSQLRQEGKFRLIKEFPNYSVAYTEEELNKSEVVLVNIAIDLANEIHDKFQNSGSKVLRFYIDSPDKDLIRRVLGRETFPIFNNAESRLLGERERNKPEDIKKAEFVIENREGHLKETVNFISGKIKEFLNE